MQYTTMQTISEGENHMVSLAACVVRSKIKKKHIQPQCSHDKTCRADPG